MRFAWRRFLTLLHSWQGMERIENIRTFLGLTPELENLFESTTYIESGIASRN